MLHIVKTQQSLADCLAFIQAGDDILLIEEAVYALFRQNDLRDSLKDHQDHCWALTQDMQARGLSFDGRDDFQLVDFTGFVSLTEQHLQSMTWD